MKKSLLLLVLAGCGGTLSQMATSSTHSEAESAQEVKASEVESGPVGIAPANKVTAQSHRGEREAQRRRDRLMGEVEADGTRRPRGERRGPKGARQAKEGETKERIRLARRRAKTRRKAMRLVRELTLSAESALLGKFEIMQVTEMLDVSGADEWNDVADRIEFALGRNETLLIVGNFIALRPGKYHYCVQGETRVKGRSKRFKYKGRPVLIDAKPLDSGRKVACELIEVRTLTVVELDIPPEINFVTQLRKGL